MAGALTRISGNLIGGDRAKLDGIEASATADQTGAEIKAAYEAEANAFTDTKDTKLTGIDTGATKYPDTGEQAFLDADHTKLNGIDTNADVTSDRITLVASDNLVHSNDAEVTKVSSSYVMAKRINWTGIDGTIRVKYETKTSNASYNACGQVYVNSGAVGASNCGIHTTYTQFSDDISITNGDSLEVWIGGTGSATQYVQNMRVYCDVDAIAGTNNDP